MTDRQLAQITDPTNIWLTSKEAAEIWGISQSAFTRLIRTHKERLIGRVLGGESQGKPLKITKEGLFELRNIANVKSRNNTVLFSAKKKIAERAIEATKGENSKQILSLQAQIEELTKAVKALTTLKIGEKTASDIKELVIAGLPPANVAVPEIPLRKQLNNLIRLVAKDKNLTYQSLWQYLYHQYESRFNINLPLRSANAGIKIPLDYAEKNGHIEALYALASKLFLNNKSNN